MMWCQCQQCIKNWVFMNNNNNSMWSSSSASSLMLLFTLLLFQFAMLSNQQQQPEFIHVQEGDGQLIRLPFSASGNPQQREWVYYFPVGGQPQLRRQQTTFEPPLVPQPGVQQQPPQRQQQQQKVAQLAPPRFDFEPQQQREFQHQEPANWFVPSSGPGEFQEQLPELIRPPPEIMQRQFLQRDHHQQQQQHWAQQQERTSAQSFSSFSSPTSPPFPPPPPPPPPVLAQPFAASTPPAPSLFQFFQPIQPPQAQQQQSLFPQLPPPLSPPPPPPPPPSAPALLLPPQIPTPQIVHVDQSQIAPKAQQPWQHQQQQFQEILPPMLQMPILSSQQREREQQEQQQNNRPAKTIGITRTVTRVPATKKRVSALLVTRRPTLAPATATIKEEKPALEFDLLPPPPARFLPESEKIRIAELLRGKQQQQQNNNNNRNNENMAAALSFGNKIPNNSPPPPFISPPFIKNSQHGIHAGSIPAFPTLRPQMGTNAMPPQPTAAVAIVPSTIAAESPEAITTMPLPVRQHPPSALGRLVAESEPEEEAEGAEQKDPNKVFLDCCKRKQVAKVCESRCNFDVLNKKILTGLFLGSDKCPREFGLDLFTCAAQDSDHRQCCRQKRVHSTVAGDKCLAFCNLAPDAPRAQLDASYLPCWAVLNEVKSCFRENIKKSG